MDEAYIDFADEPSFCKQVSKYPNLVVLQTLSKAFGLAGIRYGPASFSSPACGAFILGTRDWCFYTL